MPADKVYIGSFESIDDKIQLQLRSLVEAAAERRDSADARRIGDLYTSFLDEAGVEKAGLTPLAARACGDRCDRDAGAARRGDRPAEPARASTCRSPWRSSSTRATPRRYVPQLGQAGSRPAGSRLLPRRRRREVPRGACQATSFTWRACSRSRRPAAATRRRRRSRSWRSRRRWHAASGRRSRTAIRSRPTTGSSSTRWRRSRPASTGPGGSPPPASPARAAT